MSEFNDLRNLAERIIRERAFEPAQLDVLLHTSFIMCNDDFPDYFRYRARVNNGGQITACDLRSPKTAVANSAMLVCDIQGQSATTGDIHRAYGESVQEYPPGDHSATTVLYFLTIGFDRAELGFGFDRESNKLVKIVINFKIRASSNGVF